MSDFIISSFETLDQRVRKLENILLFSKKRKHIPTMSSITETTPKYTFHRLDGVFFFQVKTKLLLTYLLKHCKPALHIYFSMIHWFYAEVIQIK